MSSHTRSLGARYEALAVSYLRKQGLRLINQNFHSRYGEIDLIMQHKDSLVFIEVRFRKQNQWGEAHHTVSHIKQKKIIKTAKLYLKTRGLYDKVHCRFDVVGVSGSITDQNYVWIRNAFS